MNTSAALSEPDVLEILKRLDAGEYQHIIAARYHVSTKTINRIKTGETWGDVTYRYRNRQQVSGPSLPIASLEESTIDLLDGVIAVKNNFGLSFDHPIHWGWFDGWDGLHSVVSDGIIMWESDDLVKYAQKLATCDVDEHPVWAKSAEEMPTFDIEEVMTLSVGEKFKPTMESEGIVGLISDRTEVFLHSKFVNIARAMKLDIRLAGNSDEFVYFTKFKPKSSADPNNVVIACVATLWRQ